MRKARYPDTPAPKFQENRKTTNSTDPRNESKAGLRALSSGRPAQPYETLLLLRNKIKNFKIAAKSPPFFRARKIAQIQLLQVENGRSFHLNQKKPIFARAAGARSAKNKPKRALERFPLICIGRKRLKRSRFGKTKMGGQQRGGLGTLGYEQYVLH